MGEVILRRTQAVLEAVRGTQLAATRRVYGKGLMTDKTNIIRPTNEQRGSLDMYFRSQAGQIQDTFPYDGTVTYEDLAWWFQMALKGAVTGALRNTAAYDYIFVPTQATDDLKSATIEWGDDTQAWKSGFAMVDTFDIVAVYGQGLTFKAGIMTDDWATATFTGALSDRTTEDALAQFSKLAIGAAGAVPSSYLTGRLIGWTFSVKNHLTPKYFMDGAGQKFTGMGRGAREYALQMTQEGNAATITERANFDSNTPRVVRITVTGTNIATSSPPTAKTIDLVLAGIWTAYDPGDNNTNTIFTGTLEGQYDTALAYVTSATVTNGLVTLP